MRSLRWTAILGVIAAAALLALAAWAWWHVPALYIEPAPGNDEAVQAAREATRSQAIVTTRASVLAALAGLGALVTIAINARNSAIANRNAEIAAQNAKIAAETLATTNETFRITERGHLTDRYTRAIEQLGNTDSLTIRLGGIYALQQVATETRQDEDHAMVVEVLSAFVRTTLAETTTVPTGAYQQHPKGKSYPPTESMPVDVLAAISVLAQLPDRDDMRADFSGVDFTGWNLRGARLIDGDLTEVNLRGVDLYDVDLDGLELEGADLTRAHLAECDFKKVGLLGTYLCEANASDSDFRGVSMMYADLSGADLRASNFSSADLSHADMSAANLRDADLRGANLAGAMFGDADLSGVVLWRTQIANGQLDVMRTRPQLADQPPPV